jgi:membrane protease YdiL (CAAX protease family)
MTAASITQLPPPGGGRFTRFSLVRIVLAVLAVTIPVVVTLFLAHQIPEKSMRSMWPQLLSAALCCAGYVFYVRTIEKRTVAELSAPRWLHELGAGLGLGTALFLIVAGTLAASGNFQLAGHDSATVLAKPFTEMVMVAAFEEILFRGVLFRITERSLGSVAALVVSSVLFALAHLPNAGVTALAVGATAAAGVLFAAAYMATQRLWLPIGIHFAWNFVSDGVFSVPTSGHPGAGWLKGQLSGPDWLSGGAYGVEASAVTLVLLAGASGFLLWLAVRRGYVAKSGRAGRQP